MNGSVKDPWAGLDTAGRARPIPDPVVRWIVETSRLPVAIPVLIWRMSAGFDRPAWSTTRAHLARMCGRSRPKVTAALKALELKGRIKIVAGRTPTETTFSVEGCSPWGTLPLPMGNAPVTYGEHPPLPIGNAPHPLPMGNAPVTYGEHPPLPMGNAPVTYGEHKRSSTSTSYNKGKKTTTTPAHQFPDRLIPDSVLKGRVKRLVEPSLTFEAFSALYAQEVRRDWATAGDSPEWSNYAVLWIRAMIRYLTAEELTSLVEAAAAATGRPQLKFFVRVAEMRLKGRRSSSSRSPGKNGRKKYQRRGGPAPESLTGGDAPPPLSPPLPSPSSTTTSLPEAPS